MTKFSMWISLLLLVSTPFSSIVHAQTTRAEQDHSSISYQNTWQTIQGSAVSGGSVVASDVAFEVLR